LREEERRDDTNISGTRVDVDRAEKIWRYEKWGLLAFEWESA